MRVINTPVVQQLAEYIYSIIELTNSHIIVRISYWDAHNNVAIEPNTFKEYVISKDNYVDLLSANPIWAPNKPAGTYRNEDLWRFIDIIRDIPITEPITSLS